MTLTPAELDKALRTTLARLELCSTTPAVSYTAAEGGGGEGGGIPRAETAADPFRRRLAGIEAGLQRRLNGAEAIGDEGERARAEREARDWSHDKRGDVLKAATRELANLTGRTDKPPERKGAQADTEAGLREIVEEEAFGKPADQLAAELGVSKFMVRNMYRDAGYFPMDGSRLDGRTSADLASEARFMRDEKQMTQKQIGDHLGVRQSTVSRWLNKRDAA